MHYFICWSRLRLRQARCTSQHVCVEGDGRNSELPCSRGGVRTGLQSRAIRIRLRENLAVISGRYSQIFLVIHNWQDL